MNRAAGNNGALQCACAHGHLEVVRYLVEEVGLTAEDARVANNKVLRLARVHGSHHAVVQYIEAMRRA